jgi:hypothetical protein
MSIGGLAASLLSQGGQQLRSAVVEIKYLNAMSTGGQSA